METTKRLTEDSAARVARSEFMALLDEAGLELWHAPEGFWAIRARGAVATVQPMRPMRKRRQEGRA